MSDMTNQSEESKRVARVDLRSDNGANLKCDEELLGLKSADELGLKSADTVAQKSADEMPREPKQHGTLFGLSAVELSELMTALAEPAWRGQQLAEALYRGWVDDLESVSTLPVALKKRVAEEGWAVNRPRIVQTFTSVDGTERYLVEIGNSAGEIGGGQLDRLQTDSLHLDDFPMSPRTSASPALQQTVETVWMPEGDGGEASEEPEEEAEHGWSIDAGSEAKMGSAAAQTRRWQRATICVSSQVGCAVNCQFCLTAKLGLKRNLTAGEIAGQVIAVLSRHQFEVGRDRVNLVFMGMGEPFLNYTNFMAAVRLLIDEVGLSPQRMTVSTSGIVPGIEQFATESAAWRPRLAISLNAPNNQVRTQLMPINAKWPIESVINAIRRVKLRPRERVTFEYVLLSGVTDRLEDAAQVARLVRRTGLAAKVNLIALNPGPGIPYSTPSPQAVEAFRQTLLDAGIPTYLRKPRGLDIFAACGQLKRTVEGAG